MALRYGLAPNYLTDDPNDFMGVVTNNETVTVESIVEQMIGKGSTVTKAEALSVIEEFEYTVVEAVKNGNSVHTKLFKITPSVAGVFTDQSDGFDPSRHAIRLNLNAGSRLTKAISEIELRKVEISSPQPVLQQFVDLKNNVVNESFTPGQIASIRGSLLKFNSEDPKQGIFFIANDGTETRAENVVKNKPSELLFFVPESLTSGSFKIEVRVILHDSKKLRTGQFAYDLTSV
ncbi:DNA-binding domain-containing protein [Marinifilum sp.]|uniref:DNA-binding domain-containing protein n=1 Tax=Marinifilum sp. TaxID=2033137 RepID=UPI003BA98801